jgi:RHS repeat-associated protein
VDVSYHYDPLHRLLGQSYSSAVSGSLTYEYDRYGNMTHREATDGLPNHQALALDRAYVPATNHYDQCPTCYDARGNLLTDGPYTFAPYTFNMPRVVTRLDGETTIQYTHTYDSAGRRVRTEWSGAEGPRSTLTFYDASGRLMSEMEGASTGQAQPKKDYVYAAGRLVAVVDYGPADCGPGPALATRHETPDPLPQLPVQRMETFWAGGWESFVPVDDPQPYRPAPRAEDAPVPMYRYPVLDVTGTPRMWLDEDGNVADWMKLSGAYGEELGLYRQGNFAKIGFAGLQDDQEQTGTWYTPNRILSGTGRFISADPSDSFDINDPKSFNQYAYVVQNPLQFTDPSGLLTYDPETGKYIVDKGDTLRSISSDTGVAIAVIFESNRKPGRKFRLTPGRRLVIPSEGNVRLQAFEWAAKEIGSSAYFQSAALGAFTDTMNKCNKFVADAYEHGAGVSFPRTRSRRYPIGANEIAKGEPPLSIVPMGEAGDIIAFRTWESAHRHGHVGIYTGRISIARHPNSAHAIIGTSQDPQGITVKCLGSFTIPQDQDPRPIFLSYGE